jgi:hypothetical protein
VDVAGIGGGNVAVKLASGLGLLLATSALAATKLEWVPDRASVALADAEAMKLGLPEGFGPVSTYIRYYWGAVRSGHRIVGGILISPVAMRLMNRVATQSVNIVPQGTASGFADGGCMVINVEYDVDASKLTQSDCNYELRPPPSN